jgi:dTDP-4-dehydrorhamnose reductase
MLGRDVVAAAGRAGHDVVALSRRDLDITDPRAVARAVLDAKPSAVVNCAAWTDVDGAEAEEAVAAAVNGEAAGNVARAAAQAGALVVQLSTDYVFDGTATEPYVESSAVAPASAYGRSKLAGERAVAQAAPRAAIVRAAWLFGPGGRNFVDTMLRLAGERDEVTVVDDQVGCPTYTGHLATALVEIAERDLTGVLHVAGSGACSWHDLAAAAFEATDARVTLKRGSTADLGRPAPRPAYSVLASERDEAPRLPDWREGLAAHLAATREGSADEVRRADERSEATA